MMMMCAPSMTANTGTAGQLQLTVAQKAFTIAMRPSTTSTQQQNYQLNLRLKKSMSAQARGKQGNKEHQCLGVYVPCLLFW